MAIPPRGDNAQDETPTGLDLPDDGSGIVHRLSEESQASSGSPGNRHPNHLRQPTSTPTLVPTDNKSGPFLGVVRRQTYRFESGHAECGGMYTRQPQSPGRKCPPSNRLRDAESRLLDRGWAACQGWSYPPSHVFPRTSSAGGGSEIRLPGVRANPPKEGHAGRCWGASAGVRQHRSSEAPNHVSTTIHAPDRGITGRIGATSSGGG